MKLVGMSIKHAWWRNGGETYAMFIRSDGVSLHRKEYSWLSKTLNHILKVKPC